MGKENDCLFNTVKYLLFTLYVLSLIIGVSVFFWLLNNAQYSDRVESENLSAYDKGALGEL
jgi:nitrogen fixation-related uncharacterized protein